MKFLLDTNICIAIMRKNEKARARLALHDPSACGVSVVAAYELFTGVEKCAQPEREREKVCRFLSILSVVPFDESAARHAAKVRAALEKIGMKCGPYDMLLAGHALSQGLCMVTNNLSEFSRIDGLPLEDWTV